MAPGPDLRSEYRALLGEAGLEWDAVLAAPRARLAGVPIPFDALAVPSAFVLRTSAILIGDAFRLGRRALGRPDTTTPADTNEALAGSAWGFYARYLSGECGRFEHDALFDAASVAHCDLARRSEAIREVYMAGLAWGAGGVARLPLNRPPDVPLHLDTVDDGVEIRITPGGPLVQRLRWLTVKDTNIVRLAFDLDHAGSDGVNVVPIATRIAERLALRPASPMLAELRTVLDAIDGALVTSVVVAERELHALRDVIESELGLALRDALLLHLVCYDLNAAASRRVRHEQNDLRFGADPRVRLRLRPGGRLGLRDVCRAITEGATADPRAELTGLAARFASDANQLELIGRGLHIPPRLQRPLEAIGWKALFWGNAKLSGGYMSSVVPHRLPGHWFPDFADRAEDGFVDFGAHHIAGPALSERVQVAASTCSRVVTRDAGAQWIVRTKVNPSGGPYEPIR